MVRVAIAGGTGHFGQTLVEGLVESGQHEVFVLTRRATTVFDQLSSVTCLIVCYDDEDALGNQLEEHNIEAVISTLSGLVAFETNVSLINACDNASSVKRFAPSDWLLDFGRIPEAPKIPIAISQKNILSLFPKHPNLESTVFHNGYFLDYFGQPYAPTHMPSEVPYIDIEACIASIPGSGNEFVTWTHTTDVAKFVSLALTLPPGSWKEHSWIVGDKVTFNEILETVERCRGVKFEVRYDGVEALRRGEYSPIPANKAHAALYSTPEFDATPLLMGMFAAIGVVMAEGGADIKVKESLNGYFPEVETIKVLGFIKKWWSGKHA